MRFLIIGGGKAGLRYRISSCNYIAILKLQGVIRLDIYCGKHALPLQLPECDEMVVAVVNFIRTTRVLNSTVIPIGNYLFFLKHPSVSSLLSWLVVNVVQSGRHVLTIRQIKYIIKFLTPPSLTELWMAGSVCWCMWHVVVVEGWWSDQAKICRPPVITHCQYQPPRKNIKQASRYSY